MNFKKVVLIDSLSESQGACSNCHPQLDWRCSDTTCINNTQVCDGKEDCSDGGDEQLCNFICYNMETIAMEVSGALITFFLTDIMSHRECVTKFRTVLKAKTRTIARFIIFPFEEF